MSGRSGVFHWDPEKKCVVNGPAPRRIPDNLMRVTKRGDEGGVSFQYPPGWDDGSGKVRHVKSGPFKGRVCWTNAGEARDIAARLEDMQGSRVRYDPD